MERDHWRCQWPGCYESATEKAHCIAKTRENISIIHKLWNKEFKDAKGLQWIFANVIQNDLNMKASCRKHNDYFNIGNKPEQVKNKIIEIYNTITGGIDNDNN
jgi:hypothetical protein